MKQLILHSCEINPASSLNEHDSHPLSTSISLLPSFYHFSQVSIPTGSLPSSSQLSEISISPRDFHSILLFVFFFPNSTSSNLIRKYIRSLYPKEVYRQLFLKASHSASFFRKHKLSLVSKREWAEKKHSPKSFMTIYTHNPPSQSTRRHLFVSSPISNKRYATNYSHQQLKASPLFCCSNASCPCQSREFQKKPFPHIRLAFTTSAVRQTLVNRLLDFYRPTLVRFFLKKSLQLHNTICGLTQFVRQKLSTSPSILHLIKLVEKGVGSSNDKQEGEDRERKTSINAKEKAFLLTMLKKHQQSLIQQCRREGRLSPSIFHYMIESECKRYFQMNIFSLIPLHLLEKFSLVLGIPVNRERLSSCCELSDDSTSSFEWFFYVLHQKMHSLMVNFCDVQTFICSEFLMEREERKRRKMREYQKIVLQKLFSFSKTEFSLLESLDRVKAIESGWETPTVYEQFLSNLATPGLQKPRDNTLSRSSVLSKSLPKNTEWVDVAVRQKIEFDVYEMIFAPHFSPAQLSFLPSNVVQMFLKRPKAPPPLPVPNSALLSVALKGNNDILAASLPTVDNSQSGDGGKSGEQDEDSAWEETFLAPQASPLFQSSQSNFTPASSIKLSTAGVNPPVVLQSSLSSQGQSAKSLVVPLVPSITATASPTIPVYHTDPVSASNAPSRGSLMSELSEFLSNNPSLDFTHLSSCASSSVSSLGKRVKRERKGVVNQARAPNADLISLVSEQGMSAEPKALSQSETSLLQEPVHTETSPLPIKEEQNDMALPSCGSVDTNEKTDEKAARTTIDEGKEGGGSDILEISPSPTVTDVKGAQKKIRERKRLGKASKVEASGEAVPNDKEASSQNEVNVTEGVRRAVARPVEVLSFVTQQTQFSSVEEAKEEIRETEDNGGNKTPRTERQEQSQTNPPREETKPQVKESLNHTNSSMSKSRNGDDHNSSDDEKDKKSKRADLVRSIDSADSEEDESNKSQEASGAKEEMRSHSSNPRLIASLSESSKSHGRPSKSENDKGSGWRGNESWRSASQTTPRPNQSDELLHSGKERDNNPNEIEDHNKHPSSVSIGSKSSNASLSSNKPSTLADSGRSRLSENEVGPNQPEMTTPISPVVDTTTVMEENASSGSDAPRPNAVTENKQKVAQEECTEDSAKMLSQTFTTVIRSAILLAKRKEERKSGEGSIVDQKQGQLERRMTLPDPPTTQVLSRSNASMNGEKEQRNEIKGRALSSENWRSDKDVFEDKRSSTLELSNQVNDKEMVTVANKQISLKNSERQSLNGVDEVKPTPKASEQLALSFEEKNSQVDGQALSSASSSALQLDKSLGSAKGGDGGFDGARRNSSLSHSGLSGAKSPLEESQGVVVELQDSDKKEMDTSHLQGAPEKWDLSAQESQSSLPIMDSPWQGDNPIPSIVITSSQVSNSAPPSVIIETEESSVSSVIASALLSETPVLPPIVAALPPIPSSPTPLAVSLPDDSSAASSANQSLPQEGSLPTEVSLPSLQDSKTHSSKTPPLTKESVLLFSIKAQLSQKLVDYSSATLEKSPVTNEEKGERMNDGVEPSNDSLNAKLIPSASTPVALLQSLHSNPASIAPTSDIADQQKSHESNQSQANPQDVQKSDMPHESVPVKLTSLYMNTAPSFPNSGSLNTSHREIPSAPLLSEKVRSLPQNNPSFIFRPGHSLPLPSGSTTLHAPLVPLRTAMPQLAKNAPLPNMTWHGLCPQHDLILIDMIRNIILEIPAVPPSTEFSKEFLYARTLSPEELIHRVAGGQISFQRISLVIYRTDKRFLYDKLILVPYRREDVLTSPLSLPYLHEKIMVDGKRFMQCAEEDLHFLLNTLTYSASLFKVNFKLMANLKQAPSIPTSNRQNRGETPIFFQEMQRRIETVNHLYNEEQRRCNENAEIQSPFNSPQESPSSPVFAQLPSSCQFPETLSFSQTREKTLRHNQTTGYKRRLPRNAPPRYTPDESDSNMQPLSYERENSHYKGGYKKSPAYSASGPPSGLDLPLPRSTRMSSSQPLLPPQVVLSSRLYASSGMENLSPKSPVYEGSPLNLNRACMANQESVRVNNSSLLPTSVIASHIVSSQDERSPSLRVSQPLISGSIQRGMLNTSRDDRIAPYLVFNKESILESNIDSNKNAIATPRSMSIVTPSQRLISQVSAQRVNPMPQSALIRSASLSPPLRSSTVVSEKVYDSPPPAYEPDLPDSPPTMISSSSQFHLPEKALPLEVTEESVNHSQLLQIPMAYSQKSKSSQSSVSLSLHAKTEPTAVSPFIRSSSPLTSSLPVKRVEPTNSSIRFSQYVKAFTHNSADSLGSNSALKYSHTSSNAPSISISSVDALLPSKTTQESKQLQLSNASLSQLRPPNDPFSSKGQSILSRSNDYIPMKSSMTSCQPEDEKLINQAVEAYEAGMRELSRHTQSKKVSTSSFERSKTASVDPVFLSPLPSPKSPSLSVSSNASVVIEETSVKPSSNLSASAAPFEPRSSSLLSRSGGLEDPSPANSSVPSTSKGKKEKKKKISLDVLLDEYFPVVRDSNPPPQQQEKPVYSNKDLEEMDKEEMKKLIIELTKGNANKAWEARKHRKMKGKKETEQPLTQDTSVKKSMPTNDITVVDAEPYMYYEPPVQSHPLSIQPYTVLREAQLDIPVSNLSYDIHEMENYYNSNHVKRLRMLEENSLPSIMRNFHSGFM